MGLIDVTTTTDTAAIELPAAWLRGSLVIEDEDTGIPELNLRCDSIFAEALSDDADCWPVHDAYEAFRDAFRSPPAWFWQSDPASAAEREHMTAWSRERMNDMHAAHGTRLLLAPGEVCAGQPYVTALYVATLAADASRRYREASPACRTADGKVWVIDGHHHACAAWACGDLAAFDVVNLPE